MPNCPKCGAEIVGTDAFCRNCGTRLSQVEAATGTTEDAVVAVITARIDGIRRRDMAAILKLVIEIGTPNSMIGPLSLGRALKLWTMRQKHSRFLRNTVTNCPIGKLTFSATLLLHHSQ